jgi:hypothetical protein
MSGFANSVLSNSKFLDLELVSAYFAFNFHGVVAVLNYAEVA